jgi:hypothetical protein
MLTMMLSGILNSTGLRRRKASVAVMPSALPSRTYLVKLAFHIDPPLLASSLLG